MRSILLTTLVLGMFCGMMLFYFGSAAMGWGQEVKKAAHKKERNKLEKFYNNLFN